MFGIPLTGNIENFTSKMTSKGLTLDKEKEQGITFWSKGL